MNENSYQNLAQNNALLCVKELQYAANCALWLLSQPELKHLLDGDWGDPIDIKHLLENAGCQPNCEPL